MGRMKISWRLGLTFSALTALLLAIAALALLQMAAMRTQAQSITDRWMPSAMAIQRLNASVIEMRSLQIQHVLNYTPEGMAAIEAAIGVNRAAYAKDAAAYQAGIATDEDRRLFDAFSKAWSAALGSHDELIELSRVNGKDAARALFDDAATRGRYAQARAHLATLAALNERGAAAAVQANSQAYDTARARTLAAACIALVLAAAAARWLLRSIVAPLDRAVHVADRVAAGDLTGPIVVSGQDETAMLLRSLARMQDALASTAGNVRSGAESVATASAQIAQGNSDLSARTEQQSSALQEIAATMEELAATVRNNVDSAMQAKELARGAAAVAAQGETVIDDVVRTMRDINGSSKKISDITAVIDGIAFQTNILALNAAVEAARAGEQGRGFAVVAAEVRSLAQRSAAAARQIKGLITSSVDQVDQGTVLVDRAGKTMDEILRAVRRVSEIVEEISVASVEQSDGVAEVGKSVAQMDSTTQQNAALVEQSAAAAESLKHQAHRLVGVVEVFRVAA